MFVHPNTVAKVHLIRSKKKVADIFGKYFSEETCEWLIEEIKLNKQKPLPESQRTFWKKPDKEGAHDPRGTPSYVKKYLDSFSTSNLCLSPAGNLNNIGELVHLAHPNVMDYLQGNLKNVKLTPTSERNPNGEANGATAEADLSDSEDTRDDFEEIEISEEFQIPQDAVPIQ